MTAAARPIADIFRHCWTTARPARWHWLGLGFIVASRLLDGAMVWLCGLFLDLVLVPYSFGSFSPLLVAYVLLVSAKGLIAFGEIAFGERIVGGPWRSLRQRLLGGTPLPGSDNLPVWQTGRTTSQLATDMVTIERLLPTGLLDTGASALRGLVFLTILALLHWQLALITLLVVGGCPWLIRRISRALGAGNAPTVTSTGAPRTRLHLPDYVGPALLVLLGLLLTIQGRLSPGGLLLTLAATAQLALLRHRMEDTVRLLDAAVPAATRIAALLRHQPIAPVTTTRVPRAVAAGQAPSEPLLLVGLPLALLLAFLLGGIVQASDIRPTLLFPGLRISRPVPAVAAAQGIVPETAGAAPIAASPNRPIWAATIGPRFPTPTGVATLPAAATATIGAAAVDATPTVTSGVAQPTATTAPLASTLAVSSPTTITVAGVPTETPATSPSPTAAPPPPTATPPLPVTLPPTATVPPRPIPTSTATPAPPPVAKPSPSASATENGPAGGSQSPAPQGSNSPQPSASPSDDNGGKGTPAASPTPSVSPGDDDGGNKGKPSASPSTSSPTPSASPSAAPSSGGNGGGGSGPSSPKPSPPPSAVPDPSAGASPSPDDHGGGPSSPRPSPSAPTPQPSPTPKPSGKESDDPSPAPPQTPKPSRSP